MSKDKKKKKKDSKKDKKKAKANGSLAAATKSLKAITENPLVADVVAAALVATASALKDSNKARKLAADAGDQLGDMAKDSADRGSEMWQLALEIGRQTLKSVAAEVAAQTARKGK
jgi:hypothetical protein